MERTRGIFGGRVLRGMLLLAMTEYELITKFRAIVKLTRRKSLTVVGQPVCTKFTTDISFR